MFSSRRETIFWILALIQESTGLRFSALGVQGAHKEFQRFCKDYMFTDVLYATKIAILNALDIKKLSI